MLLETKEMSCKEKSLRGIKPSRSCPHLWDWLITIRKKMAQGNKITKLLPPNDVESKFCDESCLKHTEK